MTSRFSETRGGTELGWLARHRAQLAAVAVAARIDPDRLEDAVQGRAELSAPELSRLETAIAQIRSRG